MKYVIGAVVVAAATAAAAIGAMAAASQAGADCPERVMPLPANGFGPASEAALESQRARYEEMDTRPLVVRASLARFDDARGTAARRDCGRRVGRRTIVVYLESASARFRRRNPSLSQGVVFVSRVAEDRYRVWRVVR